MSEPTVVLAECKGLGRVYLCSCESVHLKVGPVTLCLAPEAFAQAAAMMREALEELDELAKLEAARRLDQDSLEDSLEGSLDGLMDGLPLRSQFMH
jgi:hypothetical protein